MHYFHVALAQHRLRVHADNPIDAGRAALARLQSVAVHLPPDEEVRVDLQPIAVNSNRKTRWLLDPQWLATQKG